MIEILGLLIAVGGIVTLARGRGASPVLAGAAAIAGWILIEIVGGLFASEDARLWLMVGAWAWIGAVAVFVRFAVGAGRPKPDGKWSCSDCHYLNNSSSIVCEACGHAWQPAGETGRSASA